MKKSFKREIGAGVLFVALVVMIKYWFFMDSAAMIAAYAAAYNGTLMALIPTGVAVFGIHYVWRDKE